MTDAQNKNPEVAWAAAFVAAQAEMPDITKDKTANIPTKSGGSYEYSYADLASIIKTLRPVLANHQLAIAQDCVLENGMVEVTTRIYHSAGHQESFGPFRLGAGGDARAAGSAITYARRYTLCAALGIAADQDDDAHVATQAPPEEVKVPAEIQELLDAGYTDKDISKVADTIREEKGGKVPVTSVMDIARNAKPATIKEIAKRIKASDWSTPKEEEPKPEAADEGAKPEPATEETAEQPPLKVDEPAPA